MITNPVQRIQLNYGELFVRMKDREVNLNSVINSANNIRKMRGLTTVDILDYTRSSNFVEMVMATEVKLGYRAFNDTTTNVAIEYKPTGEIKRYRLSSSPLVRAVVGRNGSTWVHPFIAIDTATSLDKTLAVDVYEILMTSPIFQLREEGGDLYKELYDSVLQLTGPEGRVPAKVQLLARVVAARCGVTIRTDNTTWNYATAEQLQIRHTMQSSLIDFMLNNRVCNFQELLEIAASGRFRQFPNLPQANLAEIVKEKVVALNTLEQRFAA